MEVKIEKSKVMVFRNCGKIGNADKLYYDGKLVETVDKFSYLGFISVHICRKTLSRSR